MSKAKFPKKEILLIILLIFIILLTIPAFFLVYFENRFYPNIYIDGVNLTGKTREEAFALINPKEVKPTSLTLVYSSKTYNIPINTLDIKVDKETAINNALFLGRSGNIVEDIKNIISLTQQQKIIQIEPNLNEPVLNSHITEISKEINIEPVNAEFIFKNNNVESFSLEKEGLTVDNEKLIKEIKSKIFTTTASLSIDIPTKVVKPNVKATDLNNLGIKELIGSGTSHFAGSIQTRIFNVNLAASRISNALVAPGEEFSFNKRIGDISALSGYKQAYVIQNGQTVLGDGGGVCQVSTTLFRAAMDSGLPITERHAHAYRVHYYEEDSLPGLDATIYTPTVDFKFKNDTGHYILIQSQIDLKNLVLTFNLYGTKDGRIAVVTKPVLSNYKPAPEDAYIDDPTLPLGQTKQIDFAASGINSSFTYTVTKNDEVINKQIFNSVFRPWQAKFLRGTKV